MKALAKSMASYIKAESFEHQGHRIQIERKKGRRGLSIHLRPLSPVIVRCGFSTPIKTVVDFLKEKQLWIQKNQTRLQALSQNLRGQELKDGAKYLCLGKELSLRVQITPLNKAFAKVNFPFLDLYIPKKESLQTKHRRAIYEAYAIFAEHFIRHKAQKISETLGFCPRKLRFRDAKARWGSCSPNGTIHINWRVIVAPEECIDYVLIHEFCHLLQMNHSKKFWNLVEYFCPNYRKMELWLEKNHLEARF